MHYRAMVICFVAGAQGCHSAGAESPLDGAVFDGRDAAGSPDAEMPAVDVPMHVTTRFSIMVQVGDAPPFEAMVDTGSTGLRVLPGVVPDSAFASITSHITHITFGGKLTVSGPTALASITIGSLTTPEPIPVMLIQDESCGPDAPNCSPAAEVQSHFSGFSAIIGLGLGNSSLTPVIGNPIAQLPGQPAFVIQAPPFPGGSGNLRIAPSLTEIGSFKTFQLEPGTLLPLQNGVQSWDSSSTPMCVNDMTHGIDYCAGVLLDTGAEPVDIKWPDQTSASMDLPSGTDVSVSIGPAYAPIADFSFTVGAAPKSGLDRVQVESTTGANEINSGTAPFFLYDVLFDQAHGVVGFAAH